MGTFQQSSADATRTGVNALESAEGSIRRTREHVNTLAAGLQRGYGGSDGAAFNALLSQWLGNADVIIQKLDELSSALTVSLREHGAVQDGAQEAVVTALKGSRIFDALTPQIPAS